MSGTVIPRICSRCDREIKGCYYYLNGEIVCKACTGSSREISVLPEIVSEATLLPASEISLRDFFAGCALTGILGGGWNGTREYVATLAYTQADIMLAAKKAHEETKP